MAFSHGLGRKQTPHILAHATWDNLSMRLCTSTLGRSANLRMPGPFYEWLGAHHDGEDEVWVKVHKVGSGLRSIAPKEAIDVVRSLKQEYPRDYLFCLEEANLLKDDGEGMAAVLAYEEIVADSEKPGYFADAKLELTYFGLGDALRGQRHYAEAAHAYEEAASSNGVSPELKVRTLLAAGECHDVLGDRPAAVKDYQAAIAAGPNTSRADTARKRLKSPYHGN